MGNKYDVLIRIFDKEENKPKYRLLYEGENFQDALRVFKENQENKLNEYCYSVSFRCND